MGLLLLTLLPQEARKTDATWSLETIVGTLDSIKLSMIKIEGHKEPFRQLNEMSKDASALAIFFVDICVLKAFFISILMYSLKIIVHSIKTQDLGFKLRKNVTKMVRYELKNLVSW